MAEDLDKFIRKSIQVIKDSIDPDLRKFQTSVLRSLKFINNVITKFKTQARTDLDFLIKRKGLFYAFQYDAIGFRNKTLPFYDRFPLIFILKVSNKHFVGVNFHWISPKARARILLKLITEYPKTFFNDQRMIPINIKRFLQSIGGNNKRFTKIAIRVYRFDRLRRMRGLKVLRIPNIDMIGAIQFTSPFFKGITLTDARLWIQRSSFAKNPLNTNVYKKYKRIMEAKRPKKRPPPPKAFKPKLKRGRPPLK